MTRRDLAIAVGLVAWTLGGAASAGEPAADLKVKSLLPVHSKKRVSAVHDPEFVRADKATIPPHAWVMGILVDGAPRAYSIDLLNAHEVVNDDSKYLHFSVVWSPVANTAIVLDREYGDRILSFEPTGGVIPGDGVIYDRETKSHWSLMRGEAIAGPLKGTKLKQHSIGRRVLWKEWLEAHPDTVVLSVDGQTHWYSGAYASYFASADGFAGLSAEDRRLATKAPIFAFRLHARAHAVVHNSVEGGRVFDIEGTSVFLYRTPGSAPFESTVAFTGVQFDRTENQDWIETKSGCRFDTTDLRFTGRRCPKRLSGFDTFWYTWSLNNPETALLW